MCAGEPMGCCLACVLRPEARLEKIDCSLDQGWDERSGTLADQRAEGIRDAVRSAPNCGVVWRGEQAGREVLCELSPFGHGHNESWR